jgi:hypothetical protein
MSCIHATTLSSDPVMVRSTHAVPETPCPWRLIISDDETMEQWLLLRSYRLMMKKRNIRQSMQDEDKEDDRQQAME